MNRVYVCIFLFLVGLAFERPGFDSTSHQILHFFSPSTSFLPTLDAKNQLEFSGIDYLIT